MEFIDYYQLLRRYIWAPLLLMAVAALGGALVYFLGPVVYQGTGQMLAQPGAAYRVRWAGAEVEVTEEAEMWGTLQQLAESQTLAQRAVQEAGLSSAGLKPLRFERDKRGNMFRLNGEAGTAEVANRYVDGAMKALAQIWSQTRRDRAESMRKEIQDRLGRLTPQRDQVLGQMNVLEAGPPAGPPPEAVQATQTELAQVNGAIGTAAVDADAARNRLSALATLARRDAEARPGAQADPVIASLQARLSDLQNQRRRMLLTRTENHPEVAALDDDIRATQQELRRQQAERRQGGASTAIDQQVVLARADVQAAQARLQELRARQASLQNRLAALQAKAVAYKRLQEELTPLDTERTALLGDLQTINNEVLRLTTTSDLQVMEAAHTTESNRQPQRLVMLVAGSAAAGLILGILLILLLHYAQVAGNGRPKAVAGTPA